MTETHILLIRHPETLANVTGRFVGRGDSPFSDEGRRQLRRLPRKVAAFAPDIIWTSPLRRTLTLAQACGRAAQSPVSSDDRLLELDFGQAEGMTAEEIAEAGLRFNYHDIHSPVAPGGESRTHIEKRVASFLDEVRTAQGRVAIVTHGGVFRSSLVRLLGLEHKDIWAFHIHNAQLAHVRLIDGHGVLEKFVQG